LVEILSSLGISSLTDQEGIVFFRLPEGTYKFRVDYNGSQCWSDVVSVIPHEETDVELSLDELALNLTNVPDPVRFDGEPPVFKPEAIRVASIGSLTGLFVQGVVGQTSGEKVYYYHNDHLGTPQLMTNDSGAIVWRADYGPFGNANFSTNSTVINNFRLPGQIYDRETGLHYNYHRYYDPNTGRYQRADPIGIPGGINLYTYSENNPVNWIDFFGLEVLNPNNYPISPEVSRTLEQFNEYIGKDKDIVITGGNRPPSTDIGSGRRSAQK